MDAEEVRSLLAEWDDATQERIRAAVRMTLDALSAIAPGRSVEVRIPPYAAVQVVAGTTHRRGTPPAVVEADARTWLALCVGEADWQGAVASGRVRASGERSDLGGLLPLPHLRPRD